MFGRYTIQANIQEWTIWERVSLLHSTQNIRYIAKRTTKGRGHSLAFFVFSEEVRPFKNTWISAVTISSMSLFIITAQAVYSLLSISIDVDHALRYYFYECGHAVIDSADFTRLRHARSTSFQYINM